MQMQDLAAFAEREIRLMRTVKLRAALGKQKMPRKHSSPQKHSQADSHACAAVVEMLVFDDIVVFLHKSGGVYSFYSHDNKEAVLPLEHLLVRTREDDGKTGIYLVVRPPARPELYEIRVARAKEVGVAARALPHVIEK